MNATKNNIVKNFKGDIKLAKDINFNSLRTSIQ
jgi:beta-glucosidase/6-phospho-beta-glucosidase/beta-galactosidase